MTDHAIASSAWTAYANGDKSDGTVDADQLLELRRLINDERFLAAAALHIEDGPDGERALSPASIDALLNAA